MKYGKYESFQYWLHVVTHFWLYDPSITFHRPEEWEWSYEYFWYDGPHRMFYWGPIRWYISA